jgi:endoglucanase
MLKGWNLGNTLDATPNEGSWNNPPVKPETFDDVKKAGFKSIRLPGKSIVQLFTIVFCKQSDIDRENAVTWTTKIGPAPNYTVDPKWLERVSTVVDQITSRGLYVIVNVHHDSWEWFDFSAAGANTTALATKFEKLWTQIGSKLACTSSLVAFEPINEAKGSTKEHADIMNKMNGVFLKAINDVGGFNPQRVVNLVGLGEDGTKTSQWFKKPEGAWKNPWALQYHYYSPCKLLKN